MGAHLAVVLCGPHPATAEAITRTRASFDALAGEACDHHDAFGTPGVVTSRVAAAARDSDATHLLVLQIDAEGRHGDLAPLLGAARQRDGVCLLAPTETLTSWTQYRRVPISRRRLQTHRRACSPASPWTCCPTCSRCWRPARCSTGWAGSTRGSPPLAQRSTSPCARWTRARPSRSSQRPAWPRRLQDLPQPIC